MVQWHPSVEAHLAQPEAPGSPPYAEPPALLTSVLGCTQKGLHPEE
jgi:hypothetical protein